MTNSPSLLAELAPWFIQPLEDRGTDALAYIFAKSSGCMMQLNRLLRDGGFRPAPITEIGPQIAVGPRSRPDLVGCDEAHSQRLIVESKFWAPLQPAQAPRYVDALAADGQGVLLFIVPRKRFDEIWPKITAQLRARTAGLTLSEGETDADTDMWRAEIVTAGEQPNHGLMMVSWLYLLNQLNAGAETTSVQSDIHQLIGLAQRQEDEGFGPLTPDAGTAEFAERDTELRRMVYEAVDRGRGEGWLITEGLRASPRWDGYGRYACVSGTKTILRLGVEYSDELYARTPTWVSVHASYFANPERPPRRLRGSAGGALVALHRARDRGRLRDRSGRPGRATAYHRRLSALVPRGPMLIAARR